MLTWCVNSPHTACAASAVKPPWTERTERVRQLDREPRLAAAPRAEQGDEPVRQYFGAQAHAFGVTAEEARQVNGQGAAAHVDGRAPRGARRRAAGAARHAVRGQRARHVGRQGLCRFCGGCCAVEQGRQAAAFGLHPVVIEPGQQLAGVERNRPCMPALAHVVLERLHVARDGAGHDAQAQPVGQHHGRRVRPRRAGRRCRLQPLAQREQRLAQAVAAHVERHAGPDQVDQLFACMAALREQRQPGEQRADTAAAEVGERHAAALRPQAAEQLHAPRAAGRRRAGRCRVRCLVR